MGFSGGVGRGDTLLRREEDVVHKDFPFLSSPDFAGFEDVNFVAERTDEIAHFPAVSFFERLIGFAKNCGPELFQDCVSRRKDVRT